MISKKLKIIFLISIPLFVVHGVEEYFTGFYNVDAWDQSIFQPFMSLSVHQAMFATFQIMFWLLLAVSFLLVVGGRWQFRLLAVLGIIYVFELHHVFKALLVGGYYPGLITALAFPFIAFFFWKEYLKNLSLN